MIHFFTIVLNGMPYIRYHLPMLSGLPFPWHWHVIEGVAKLTGDTGWGLRRGAFIPSRFHTEAGLSIDGTTEYLRGIYGPKVTVYWKDRFWDGKLEMVREPLGEIKEDCLLWQLDVDELWTVETICNVVRMFEVNPNKHSAYFYCDYFVGPKKFVVPGCIQPNHFKDWLRVWRFSPGMEWVRHEPPVLVNQNGEDVGKINPFTMDDTMKVGMSFQHFAYARLQDVEFKEKYYGYHRLVEDWRKIQSQKGRITVEERYPNMWFGTTLDDWDESKQGKLLTEGL